MTLELLAPVRGPSLLAAAVVLARATAGLVLHGLRHPGGLAVIDRTTGRVMPR